MTVKPILLLAVGNESRGDDALGPWLARRVAAWLEQSGGGASVEAIEIIEEFQLQIENALDLPGRELILLVDAGQGTPSPFVFYEAAAAPSDGYTSHAVTPEALLGVFARVHQSMPPPTFVLCLSGVSFELGEPLSGAAARHLEQAVAFCRELFGEPATLAAWRERVETLHA